MDYGSNILPCTKLTEIDVEGGVDRKHEKKSALSHACAAIEFSAVSDRSQDQDQWQGRGDTHNEVAGCHGVVEVHCEAEAAAHRSLDTVLRRRPVQDSNNNDDSWWLREIENERDMPESQDSKDGYASFLERLVSQNTRLPANRVQHQVKRVAEAIATTSSSSIFFVCRPIETILLKPFFRLALLGFIVRNVVFICITWIPFAQHNWASHFSLYRLSNLPAVINASSVTSPFFGLLTGGYMAPIQETWWTDSSLVMQLETSCPIDGWHVLLPADTKLHLLRRVDLEGSEDGTSWTRTSVPWAYGATIQLRKPFQRLDDIREHEKNIRFFAVDFRYTFESFVKDLEHPISLIGLSLTLMYSFKFQGRMAKQCAAWSFCMVGLAFLLQIPLVPDLYQKLYALQGPPPYFFHGVGMFFLNRGYLHVILAAGLWVISFSSVLVCFNPDHKWITGSIVGSMQVVLWVAIVLRVSSAALLFVCCVLTHVRRADTCSCCS